MKDIIQNNKNKNAFLKLGYGTNAYFRFVELLIYMFIMLTVFSAPLYYFYKGNEF